MGRPGNKRLQRAMYGASPSSANGSTTTEGSVTRVTGSVINNGGNMRSGGYPRIGMGLEFLRKTRVTENCCFVGSDEDLKTQLELATAYYNGFTNSAQAALVTTAANVLTTADATATTATNTATATPTAVNIASEAVAIKAEADALADYNAKKAVLDAMNTKYNAATIYKNAETATNLAAWLAAN